MTISVENLNTIVMFAGFALLLMATFLSPHGMQLLRNRNKDDWFLDITGLWVQGLLIPLLKVLLVVAALRWTVPEWEGVLSVDGLWAFLISFVIVDYAYYWNHRCFHTKSCWPVHMVHHTAPQMDVLVTSRNTLWTSFFIVYLWAHGLMLFLLEESTAYFWGVTVTALLDLWRHSRLQPKGVAEKILGLILILPNDHRWHHSRDRYGINFGANLNLWDRWHGTWYRDADGPTEIGVATNINLLKKLWWPF